MLHAASKGTELGRELLVPSVSLEQRDDFAGAGVGQSGLSRGLESAVALEPAGFTVQDLENRSSAMDVMWLPYFQKICAVFGASDAQMFACDFGIVLWHLAGAYVAITLFPMIHPNLTPAAWYGGALCVANAPAIVMTSRYVRQRLSDVANEFSSYSGHPVAGDFIQLQKLSLFFPQTQIEALGMLAWLSLIWVLFGTIGYVMWDSVSWMQLFALLTFATLYPLEHIRITCVGGVATLMCEVAAHQSKQTAQRIIDLHATISVDSYQDLTASIYELQRTIDRGSKLVLPAQLYFLASTGVTSPIGFIVLGLGPQPPQSHWWAHWFPPVLWLIIAALMVLTIFYWTLLQAAKVTAQCDQVKRNINGFRKRSEAPSIDHLTLIEALESYVAGVSDTGSGGLGYFVASQRISYGFL